MGFNGFILNIYIHIIHNRAFLVAQLRSPGDGIGCPLKYSCTSLVAQLVKNLPAKQETWVQSLGGEDPLEEGMATHSGILA